MVCNGFIMVDLMVGSWFTMGNTMVSYWFIAGTAMVVMMAKYWLNTRQMVQRIGSPTGL